MIQVKNIPGKGRGIIATQFIPQTTIIETAPAIAISAQDRKTLDTTQIFQY